MKKNFIFIFTFLLSSGNIFGQSSKDQLLKNTQWQSLSYYGGKDTREFAPLKEPQNQKSKLDYIRFSKDNTYVFHLYYNSKCSINLSGNYAVTNSKITFPNYKTTKSKGCTDKEEMELEDMSVIFHKNKLYLTQYTASYDVNDTKIGDTILLNQKLVGNIEQNEEDLYTVKDTNRIPLKDGIYRITDQSSNGGTLIFTLKNDVIDGAVIAENGGKKKEMLYKDGRLLSEVKWIAGNKFLEEEKPVKVKKDKKDFIITITDLRRNRSDINDSIVTVYKNKKPVLISSYEYGNLASTQDFIKKEYKRYGANQQLLEYDGLEMGIIYDSAGKEKKKQIYGKKVYEEYEYGILKLRRNIDENSFTTTKYDDAGNEISKEKKAKSNELSMMVADPTKYAEDLSEKYFEYYKTLAK